MVRFPRPSVIDRRHFGRVAAGGALTAILRRPLLALPSDDRYLRRIGLQLWTVRFQLEQDVAGTLQSIADAGYRQVELMDVMAAEPLTKVAADKGLDFESSFLDWNVVVNPTQQGPKQQEVATFAEVVDQAHALGLRHLVFGYIGKGFRETTDQYQWAAERANRLGELCRSAGIQLSYHNHSFEFAPLSQGAATAGSATTTGFDLLIRHFDRELVKFELDVFWAAIGGTDPVQLMRRLEGRIAQLHLKDLLPGTPTIHDESQVPHETFKELGAGGVALSEVLKLARQHGVDLCHVEQDRSPDPLASIRTSIDYLRSLA